MELEIANKMHYILDENKDPVEVGVEEHSEWFKENRILKNTDLFGGDIRVSSVFVGKPQIGGMFETLILNRRRDIKSESVVESMKRCRTYKDCLKDHEDMVLKVSEYFGD